jgi:hypothetical protein
MELKDIGNIELGVPGIDQELTIKEFLKELLKTLWLEGESFSARRPFGYSGWEDRVYAKLIRRGIVTGELDGVRNVISVDAKTADKIICDIIASF